MVLAICLLATAAFAVLHSHAADQGRSIDPTCPVCQLLLGFVLAAAGAIGLGLTIAQVGLAVPVPILVRASVPPNSKTSRAPPAC
jgi:hypothetical protein